MESGFTENYAQCVARVKRDYPVPPGNINTQNQMISDECGGLLGIFPSSAKEAASLGYERVSPPSNFDSPDWTPGLNGICYTGPCIAGTVTRTVCYFDSNGACSQCYAVPDHACGA